MKNEQMGFIIEGLAGLSSSSRFCQGDRIFFIAKYVKAF